MAAGDWDAVTLADATLKGIVPVDFQDADFGEFDTDLNETNRLAQAKRYIENRLFGALPELVVRADGAEEFMDAAASISSIDNLIQEMLAWSYLLHWYEQERFSGADVYNDKRMLAEHRFEQMFTAFVKYIPKDPNFIDAAEATASTDLSRFSNTVFVG